MSSGLGGLGEVRFRDFAWRPMGRRSPVIAGLDLHVQPGERVLLVGPSGAGKSTILHALVGALGTTLPGDVGGSAEVTGRAGLLLQNPADSVVAQTVGRDVAFGLENRRWDPAAIWPVVDDALESVGLAYGRGHHTGALSGGEQQRLAVAGVLAMSPDVWLLDEPTSMLDDATATQVTDAIVNASAGRTVIVVEHRLERWLPHVDRVVVLSADGQIAADATPDAFLSAPAPPGVWMPGAEAPALLDVPTHLVAPDVAPGPITALGVSVDLTIRSLRGSTTTRAVDGLTLTLEPGLVTGFTGPSGAGKSTALAALGGLIKPSAGRITPDGARMRSIQLAAQVGWVPQNPEHGFLTTRVIDEVSHTAGRLGRDIKSHEILETFGLGALAHAHPYRLSGGEQRRLALAAALAHRPGCALLDEPTVGQDPGTWAAVVGWMQATASAGAVVAVSTHDASVPLDRRIAMKSGALL